jgi:hypothetical protein
MRHGWITGAAVAALGLGATAGSLAPSLGSAGAAVTGYRLSASGTGMQLTLDGHTLVAATSSVSAGTGSPVDATASGELSPTHISTQRATADGPGASQTAAQVCTVRPPSGFPAPFSTAVTLGAACSSASAQEGATGLPTASATGSVASLGIAPAPSGTTTAGALSPLGAALPTPVLPGSPLASALSAILGPLPALPAGGLPLATVVQQVAATATGSTVTGLMTASFGPSASALTSTGGTLTARSSDTGATVALLTGAGSGGGPLLAVDVGRAVTQAGVDRADGHVTETATAASVSVTVAPPVGTRHTVSITPGTSKSFLTGTPLQTTISVSSPSTTARTGLARASGVVVDLAQGTASAGLGGVVLDLGVSVAQASATIAPPAATATPTSAATAGTPGTAPVLTGATTVHTGEPWAGPLPIALLTMSLLAGLGLLARRHLLAMGHHLGRATGRVVHVAGTARRHSAGPGLRDLLRSPSGAGPGPAGHRAAAQGTGPPRTRAVEARQAPGDD